MLPFTLPSSAQTKTALCLNWTDAESSGYQDIIPLNWLRDNLPPGTRRHEVRGPRGGKSMAQCRIASQGARVDLDYSVFPEFNERQAMHLGVLRLTFSDRSHSRLNEVNWLQHGTDVFETADIEPQIMEIDSSVSDSPPVSMFSAGKFEQVLAIFQNYHLKQSGEPLRNFRDATAYVYERENYKIALPARAYEELNVTQWKKKQIGNGQILKSVIRAIELHGNNLIRWHAQNGPSSRAHHKLYEALDNHVACETLEHAFWKLYKLVDPCQEVFEAITEYCGRRYELLGYLFFLAEPHKFLPIRTKAFDQLADLLGAELRTSRSCGWANYLSYGSVMAEIQRNLISAGFVEATLLDAHSFCWLVVESQKSNPATIYDDVVSIPVGFKGKLKPAQPKQDFNPKINAPVRDMENESRRKVAAGARAEEVALKSEEKRLEKAGRSDLKGLVITKAQQPALGFDILSVEKDGKTKRFIEVKNVSNGRLFYLSVNQWLNCQARENYWFYLVDLTKKGSPVVQQLDAKNLRESHLLPVEFLVSFSG